MKKIFFDGKTLIYTHVFFSFQNLIKLDLSHNGLSSTKLGTQLQLENLQELLLSNNKIHVLSREELDFLGNSSLKKLELSSNQIKEVRSKVKLFCSDFKCGQSLIKFPIERDDNL